MAVGVVTPMLWIIVAFLCGSLPFAVWIGRVALGKDITQIGDGNPGAANVWRAGARGWGIVAVLLDFLKGATPVALAHYVVGLDGSALASVAIAPIAGHAFSPFLRFRGGKALAVTFGIWSGLTIWIIPAILGVLFGISLALLKPDAWAVIAGMLGLFVILLLAGNMLWLEVWAGMAILVGWKHRADLAERPKVRPLR